MAAVQLIDELRSLLSSSDSVQRKHWAKRIVNEKIPVMSLMSLLHGEKKTAQRFTWLIGDLLEADPDVVRECVPLLFSLRDQMPFPGMRRSVGKCLWYAGVPKDLETEAIAELFHWLKEDEFAIGCKHYAAKALFDMARQERVDRKSLENILKLQTGHSNSAHAKRMQQMLDRLEQLD